MKTFNIGDKFPLLIKDKISDCYFGGKEDNDLVLIGYCYDTTDITDTVNKTINQNVYLAGGLNQNWTVPTSGSTFSVNIAGNEFTPPIKDISYIKIEKKYIKDPILKPFRLLGEDNKPVIGLVISFNDSYLEIREFKSVYDTMIFVNQQKELM